MRNDPRGDAFTSAHAIVEVVDRPYSRANVRAAFEVAGFQIFTGRNAPVIVAVRPAKRRPSDLAAAGLLVAAAGLALTLRASPATIAVAERQTSTLAEGQPVWNATTLEPLGLELRVADDEDAFIQLDALAEALGLERPRITIKPRVGWRGYGHPDIAGLP